MPSLSARIVRRALRAMMKPLPDDDHFVAELRDQTDGRPPPSVLGRRVGQRAVAPGELGQVAGEWVGVPAASRHILYLHGGYYVAGRTQTYRNLAAASDGGAVPHLASHGAVCEGSAGHRCRDGDLPRPSAGATGDLEG